MNKTKAIEIIDRIIEDSSPYLQKFKEGTSNHSLIRNRIKALEVSKYLIQNNGVNDIYSKEELEQVIKPILSIISKTSKVVLKLKEGTYHYNRSNDIISAMNIAREEIERKL